MCRNGALSEICDFLDFGRCVEFILKLKDGSKQDLCEYQIFSLVHPPSMIMREAQYSLYFLLYYHSYSKFKTTVNSKKIINTVLKVSLQSFQLTIP